MRVYYILMLFICAITQSAYCGQKSPQSLKKEPLFKQLTLKKINRGIICDTCVVDFFHHYDGQDCSFVLMGIPHTPLRLSHLRDSLGNPVMRGQSFIISAADFSFSFLPVFLKENGKRIPLFRNGGGLDYNELEFFTSQNGKVHRSWTRINSLGESKDFAILGLKNGADEHAYVPWNRSFLAGNFHLAVRDTLVITVRNILTKKIVQRISFFRAEDRATKFLYYQIPLASNNFSLNLQDVLNINAKGFKVYHGDTVNVFEKDYAAIGLLRFLFLNRNEQVQYSFKAKPYDWKTVGTKNSEDGIFLVLGNNMKAGKDHDIYLRFKSQPETIHRITIRVKQQPFRISWMIIAVSSCVLLAVAGLAFFLWRRVNKRKLAKLKQKNEDTESRLALLSGQLNPHFLFNSLNAIQGTLKAGNPDRVYSYIGNVAGFMRDVMDNGKKEFISLQEELKIESDYLTLEQERKAFSFHIDVAAELDPSLIDLPPLLLQPVLENSIRHAFGPGHTNPNLEINISRQKNNLIIKISDNGRTHWETQGMQYGHGLSLTHKRITVYNEKLEGMWIRMEISYLEGSGTMTIFTLQNWLL